MLIYIIILFLLIAGISLLFIPFYFSFQLTKDREITQKNISIKWIFLSIHYDYDGKVYTFSCLNKPLFKKLKKKKKKIKKDKKEDFLKTISLLKKYYPQFYKLLKNSSKGFSVRDFTCNLTFGFSDPADTGILSGYLYALQGLIKTKIPQSNVRINPVFIEEIFEYKIKGSIKIKFYSSLFAIFKFILK
ncbi:MAG: DUF2953 domain-containing protein [Methanosarcinales archaeon]